jgi:hypothetical protein
MQCGNGVCLSQGALKGAQAQSLVGLHKNDHSARLQAASQPPLPHAHVLVCVSVKPLSKNLCFTQGSQLAFLQFLLRAVMTDTLS